MPIPNKNATQRDPHAVAAMLRSEALTRSEVRNLWQGRDEVHLERQLLALGYERLADQALNAGESFFAAEIAEEARKRAGSVLSPRLQRIRLLALVRGGALSQAHQLIGELRPRAQQEERIAALLATACEELATLTGSAEERDRFHHEAYTLALRAHELSGAPGHAIHAATMALFFDNWERAEELATRTLELCTTREAETAHDYRVWATKAKAHLILADYPAAETEYRRAFAFLGAHRPEKKLAIVRQARRLLPLLGKLPASLLDCFRMPPVVVFCGQPEACFRTADADQREACEEAFKQAMRQRLQNLRPAVGFSPLACELDILFGEVALERGLELHVVLPFPEEEASEYLEEQNDDPVWSKRFYRVLVEATSLNETTRELGRSQQVAFSYGDRILNGQAMLKARNLATEVIPLTVGDGEDQPGGARDFAAFWSARAVAVETLTFKRPEAAS